MPLTANTRLGTYEIVALLGAGGMGEVYRARDTRLGRDVALKVLTPEFARDTERLARFEREARTVAGLNHPNIVTLFSVDDEDDVRFLTMELVEGKGLDQLVTPGGLPIAQVLELGIAIADALAAAHERGVVHRDLKPANVMVTREGRVKVLDFGLAKLVAPEPTPDVARSMAKGASLSMPGQVVGTVPYMAPEQLTGMPVDARSDLFALGIMLYELASGRRPFAGATVAQLMSAILVEAPLPVEQVRSDLPTDLGRIIGRCLEKDTQARFQTAREVRDELRALWRDVERGGPSPGSTPGMTSSLPVTGSTAPWPLAPASSDATNAVMAPIQPLVPSIAVLPFVNRSRSEEDEYFSDGLADELINVLAQIRGLRVAARSSAFTFKGRQATIAEVGAALNVSTVLEGSVRKAGNRVRISTQLVRVSDGDHLWADTYDRTLEDIFAVQDDIAHVVVKALRTTLLGMPAGASESSHVRTEVAAAVRGRGSDPEALRRYLQARHFIVRGTREDVAMGIAHLKGVLELEPGYALAWAALGGAYAAEADRGWAPLAEGYARAREAVKKALALEPDLAEAHARMGAIQAVHDWDWRRAEQSFARALELAPGNATALRGAAALTGLSRSDEAITLYRRALEQDPLSAAAYSNLGLALHAVDRHAESEAACRKSLALAPRRSGTHAILAVVLAEQTRHDDALAEAMQEPAEALRLWALAILHHAAGRRAESDDALRDLTARYADSWAAQIAEVHAARGEPDAAFEWLERAYAQRDGGLTTMKTSPQMRALHTHPLWRPFLTKMGFTD